MSVLTIKLLRGLWGMKGQMLTIALVVASGIAAFISLRGNYELLLEARRGYYERYRFADVFASLERAPLALGEDLEAIEGVARVHLRIVKPASMPIEGMHEPVRARLISIRADEPAALNAIHLQTGRMVRSGSTDEVVVLAGFAAAHRFKLGDELAVVMNGRMRRLRMVGTGMSPEYVMAMPAGELSPDPKRFAVLWMDHSATAAAYGMQSAFNDVSFALQPNASTRAVLTRVDVVLRPYGGVGAIPRAKQLSHFMIEGELMQLESMSSMMPLIFLGVAALLLNVVLSRLVHQQRTQIAVLKALGYTDLQVGLHFLQLVTAVAATGAGLGVAFGAWLGSELLAVYLEYFKFPNLVYRLDAKSALIAIGISLLAAIVGAFGAVRKVVKLPPAEAMRPAAPTRYRRSMVDRLGLARVVGPVGQMIVRELERRPLRTLLSALAISMSVGLMVVGGWYYDGLDTLIYTQFHEVMREDMMVVFSGPTPERAVREMGQLPGVRHAEGLRVIPVRFYVGHRHRDGSIIGYPRAAQLRSLRDMYGVPSPLPPDGVVLTDMLATLLDVEVGDRIEVQLHDGDRRRREVVVSGRVDEAFGLQGHMQLDALQRWRGEEGLTSMALLRVDPQHETEIENRIKHMPRVLSVTRRSDILARFKDQSAGMILTFTIIITLFAATITVGVVYNNARVALSVRGRDLASLRVLGFRRTEISGILMGEMAVQVLLAIPIGLLLGRAMVLGIANTVDPEAFRLPVILDARTYSFAIIITVAAGALSALLVRRRLDKLDLIGVLKTRE